ncbi:MAG: hypothetical protein ACXW2Y_02400 [Acidimicrobiia bacterium]
MAHGIESRDELDALVGIGVPLGQGYFVGKPGPGGPVRRSGAITSRPREAGGRSWRALR